MTDVGSDFRLPMVGDTAAILDRVCARYPGHHRTAAIREALRVFLGDPPRLVPAPADDDAARRAIVVDLVACHDRKAFADEMSITPGALRNLLNGHARVTDEMLTRARAAASALKAGGVAP